MTCKLPNVKPRNLNCCLVAPVWILIMSSPPPPLSLLGMTWTKLKPQCNSSNKLLSIMFYCILDISYPIHTSYLMYVHFLLLLLISWLFDLLFNVIKT